MFNSIYSSRDTEYLDTELSKRVDLAFSEYQNRHPEEPQPFITETYRSPEKQNDLYAQGRTKPGKIVTWVRGGESYHNMFPSLAFDIAFNIPAAFGGPWSRLDLFDKFAVIAKELDIEWGGDWVKVDRPHFQVPRYSIKSAIMKESIGWNPLPTWAQEEDTVFKVELPFERVFLVSKDNKTYELELEVVNIVGNKLYIKTETPFFIPE